MFEWLTVLVLLAFGIMMVLLEIIFVPGITIVGLIGVMSMAFGVYMGYDYFGNDIGHLILGSSLTIGSFLLYLSFKQGFWTKFALSHSLTGKVNDERPSMPTIGHEGLTVSALRPMGMARFKDYVFEVVSREQLIPPGKKVQVVQVQGGQIYVEPAKEQLSTDLPLSN